MKCNRDCFNCVFEDCIEDELTLEEYKQEAELDKEILFPKTAKEKKIAAGQKAYREANREKINQYMREYRRERRRSEVSAR